MDDSSAPLEAFQEAVRIAGGQKAFARIVGCTQGNIWQLLNKKRPLSSQFVLAAETATGISRHELRPDLYPRESGDDPVPSTGLEPAR